MALPRYIPHYSVENYQSWQGDWELWSGVPVAMSPSADRVHQRLAGLVFRRLADALQKAECGHCEALFEIDWIVSDDTVFRPDVLVACGDRHSKWIETTPPLVVEILSPSTRSRDLLFKREAYAGLGVRYYLLVDPSHCKVTLLRHAEDGYEETHDPSLHLADDCNISLDLDGLFADQT